MSPLPSTTGFPIPTLEVSMSKTKTLTRYLLHNAEQQQDITRLYEMSMDISHSFTKGDPGSQLRAQALLKSLGLDTDSRSSLEGRWSVRWSSSWAIADGADSRRRTLFQCACGYSPAARQILESKKPSSTTNTSLTWERRVPFDFTGCLAHVEITERCSDGEVSSIAGYFDHNTGCQSAMLNRLPAVPLHDHVYEVAVDQLEAGASITAIQARNREMIDKKLYRDMHLWDPNTSNVRFHLLQSDHTTLYRKFNRRQGVDTRKQPQYNIDDWLNPLSPNYRQEIADAIFYYKGRSDAGERFKVCISTPEMKDASWKYAHHSQLVLDGTFGICTSRLLLFIALGRDENGKGVPLAFFLFSAPTGNRATHAGYNTDILEELIREWKVYLGTHPETGETFEPYVAITDTDTKERGALLRVWASICLLLCKFHLRQCWTNHRKTALRVKGSDYWKDFVLNSLRSLETELIATIDHSVALGLIGHYRVVFNGLATDSTKESYCPARGGLKHLDYLLENWMSLPLWQSWSEWGRIMASNLLKIPVEGVIPTTNHLESFNAILKRKHLAAWLHSGHRLRFDFLISLLITRILPGVYDHRRSQQDYKDWLAIRFSGYSGGANLAEIHAGLKKEREAKEKNPICWWNVDPIRDAAAEQILQRSLLFVWRLDDANTYLGRCYSSAPLDRVTIAPGPVIYDITVHRSGQARCSCQDFISRGGACKHLRGVRILIESWISGGHESAFHFPKSRVEAESLSPIQNVPANVSTPYHHQTSSEVPPAPVHPTSSGLGLPFDPVLLQSLGDDTTTLDDEPEEKSTVQLVGDSDSDSQYDLDKNGHSTTSHLPTVVLGVDREATNKAAIDGQLQRRLEYDIRHLLPALHGIANTLSDTPRLTPSPYFQEFSNLLTNIQNHLGPAANNLLSHQSLRSSTPVLSSDATRRLTSPRVRHAPYPRRLLIPPSPEKRQKRKDSHAPI